MSSVDAAIRGANFGFGLIDRKDAKQRQAKQDERQEVYDARQEVQWEQQDQQFEQNSFLQARRLASDDLELGLQLGDENKIDQASRALGLKPWAFTSDRYQQHSQTLESYRAGNIRQNDPAFIELLNDVMAEDLKNRPNAQEGWNYEFKTSVPSPDGQAFQFLLEVTDENGKTWEAPLTEDATVGKGKVKTVVPRQLLNRIKSYLDIGGQLHSNPESSSVVDEILGRIRDNDISQQKTQRMDQMRRGYGLPSLNPQEPDSDQDVWAREFEQHMGRAPTTDEMGGQFGIQPSPISPTMQKVRDYMQATNSDTIPTPVLNELFGVDNVGQDPQSKWRYVKEADGHNYWIDGPQAGDRAVPDAGGKPSGSNDGNNLSYQRAVDSRIFELMGIQENAMSGLSTSNYLAENRRIQNALSKLAISYGSGQNYTADVDQVVQALQGLPLTIEEAMTGAAQDLGIDLENNPEAESEVMEAAQLQIRRNLKIIEARMASNAGSGDGDAPGTQDDPTAIFFGSGGAGTGSANGIPDTVRRPNYNPNPGAEPRQPAPQQNQPGAPASSPVSQPAVLGEPKPLGRDGNKPDAQSHIGRVLENTGYGIAGFAKDSYGMLNDGVARGLNHIADMGQSTASGTIAAAQSVREHGDRNSRYADWVRQVEESIGGGQFAQGGKAQNTDEFEANKKILAFLYHGRGKELLSENGHLRKVFTQDPEGFMYAAEQGMQPGQIVEFLTREGRIQPPEQIDVPR